MKEFAQKVAAVLGMSVLIWAALYLLTCQELPL